jgi:hypothetical protein
MKILNQIPLNKENPEDEYPSEICEMSIDSINNIVSNRKKINSHTNAVKILLDQREKDQNFLDLCLPNFKLNEVSELFNTEVINCLKKYSSNTKNLIFAKYCKNEVEKIISYINIYDFNSLIFDFPIFSSFDCNSIALVINKFIYPKHINEQVETQMKIFSTIFDERMDIKLQKDNYDIIDLNSDEMNITYSTLMLILGRIGVEIYKDKSITEAINLFFTNVLEIDPDDKNLNEPLIEESVDFIDIDYYQESKTIAEAKRMKTNPNHDDENFIQDFLNLLDRDLPEIPSDMKSFQNKSCNHSNDLYYNPLKVNPVKFPLMLIQTEINFLNEKKLEAKEELMILKAKKPVKMNAKGPVMKDPVFEDYPDPLLEKKKYFGTKPPENLKQRLLKNSYKEVLSSHSSYPSQLKEMLLIPKTIPKEVKLFFNLDN